MSRMNTKHRHCLPRPMSPGAGSPPARRVVGPAGAVDTAPQAPTPLSRANIAVAGFSSNGAEPDSHSS